MRNQALPGQGAGPRRPLVADRLCELGRFGQKAGVGWHRYHPGRREPSPDAELSRIIEECAREAGIVRRLVRPEEMVERPIFALVNEGARIFEEGVAFRAADIDLVLIYGYGFPAHRGGPMWLADTIGLQRVYDRIKALEKMHGLVWSPAPLLKRLAEEGKSFAEFDCERRRHLDLSRRPP
jgi:3-hydroxyacyl-CoA dehydrogenase